MTAGTYSVTVTDANLCTATASATVAEPLDAITASALAADADCFGSATGAVTSYCFRWYRSLYVSLEQRRYYSGLN